MEIWTDGRKAKVPVTCCLGKSFRQRSQAPWGSRSSEDPAFLIWEKFHASNASSGSCRADGRKPVGWPQCLKAAICHYLSRPLSLSGSGDGDKAFQHQYRRHEWEVVLPELVFNDQRHIHLRRISIPNESMVSPWRLPKRKKPPRGAANCLIFLSNLVAGVGFEPTTFRL